MRSNNKIWIIATGLVALLLMLFFLFPMFDKKTADTRYPNARNDQRSASRTKSIYILPLGNRLSSSTINNLYFEVKRFLPNAQLLKGVSLPDHAYYRPRNRYQADTLIAWMSDMTKPNQIILGITGEDISTLKNGEPYYGVMGLGFRPGNACVASNFRLSNKGEFWKIAIHELGHNAGLTHCPVPTCFMREIGRAHV